MAHASTHSVAARDTCTAAPEREAHGAAPSQLPDFYAEHRVARPDPLFDLLSDSFYFAKNRAGQYVCPSQLMQEKFQLASPDAVIGKSDHDLFRMDIADRIRADDLLVMQDGVTLRDKLEVIEGANGKLYWLLTTKAPLRNVDGVIVGVQGFSKDAERARVLLEPYQAFRSCIEYLQKQHKYDVSVAYLARLASMSLSSFERKFKKHFMQTPKQFIKQMKIRAACRMLGDAFSIRRAALESGFCDQSYFTKEFKSVVGMTPRHYQLSLKEKERQLRIGRVRFHGTI